MATSNEYAQSRGYRNAYDLRESRGRVRAALRELDDPYANARDQDTLDVIDELGTLGRGLTREDILNELRDWLDRNFEDTEDWSDSEVWQFFREVYGKGKSK